MLYDPALSHLRTEFESNGRLSGASLYELFLRLIELEGEEIAAYIDSVTPADLSAARELIQSTIEDRTGLRNLEYPELGQSMYDTIVLP